MLMLGQNGGISGRSESTDFGGTAYLSRLGGWDGVAISTKQAGILDVWFESTDDTQVSALIDTYGSLGFRLDFSNKKLALVRGTDCFAYITPEIEADGNFHHVLISWNSNVNQVSCVLDNAVSGFDSISGTNPTIQDTGKVSVGFYGAIPSGTPIAACVHRLWYLPVDNGTFVDVHNSAIYRKFIKADGTPEDLGTNGELPFNQLPALYMKGKASEFVTNLGYGGVFTTTGTLKNCPGKIKL